MNKFFAVSYTIFSLCFPSTLYAVEDFLPSFIIEEPTNGKFFEIDTSSQNTEENISEKKAQDINNLDISTLLEERKNPALEDPNFFSIENEEALTEDSSLLMDVQDSTRSTSNAMENVVDATKEIQKIIKNMGSKQKDLAQEKIIPEEEARTAAVLLRNSYLFVLEGLEFCSANKKFTTPSQDPETAKDSFISRNAEILSKLPLVFNNTSELTQIEKETNRVFIKDFIENYFNTNKHCAAHYDDIVSASVDLKKNSKTSLYVKTMLQFIKQQNITKVTATEEE